MEDDVFYEWFFIMKRGGSGPIPPGAIQWIDNLNDPIIDNLGNNIVFNPRSSEGG